MSEYFIYYASINMVSAVIFGIMLTRDRLSVDRQEKQLKYDRALASFMLYFISDAIWSGVDSGVFPRNPYTVLATDFSNFVLMTAITYNWLRYVMAFEQIPNRNDKKVEAALILPFAVSIVALVATYLVSPGLLIDENMKTTGMFDVFLVVVPYLYLIVMIIYAVRKSRQEDSLLEKKRHLYVGFIPVITVIGGLLQMILMPALPIFCFASTLLMLAFFIQSIEAQVSTDPLTKLNNRGQLMRYASQESNLWMDGRSTYIIMMDINDFKKINDTYGHAEGDKALVILSRTLTNVIRKCSYPIFLGRYGGDEFILIVHPANEEDLNELLTRIRTKVREQCLDQNKPYILSVGIGYDEVQKEEPDAFARSLKRADEKMYQDKERVKQRETAEANH